MQMNIPAYPGSVRDSVVLTCIAAGRPLTTAEIVRMFPNRDPRQTRMLLSGYAKCKTNPIYRVSRGVYDVAGRPIMKGCTDE